MALKLKSAVFVGIQLLSLVYLVLTGPIWPMNHLWRAVESAAIILMVWAIAVFRLRQLRIVPEVSANARLITSGPYRLIRHPMYASLLLATLALVLDQCSIARLVVWFILLFDLLGKLHHEERLLAAQFPRYGEYQRRTKRLIPWVY